MTIRKFFTLTTILFAAFSFVSCSSDDDDDENKNDVVADKHEYVDLGLPSGTLWATCNVGASKPEDYGDYFAWGEIEPKASYKRSNYKWGSSKLTKYCASSEFGDVDNNLELLPEDDAATAKWGSNWCTPSIDQIYELIRPENTTFEWTTQNGVNGLKATSKKNGNTLFFPAAGERFDDELKDAGKYGYYMSRTFNELTSPTMYLLHVDSSGGAYGGNDRIIGLTVRPVRVKK